MTTTLERRVEALEASTGGDGDCDRCRGTLVIVSDAISGEFYSASWNGEKLTREDVHEREAEQECPRCGRKIDPDEATDITVGGGPGPRQARPESGQFRT